MTSIIRIIAAASVALALGACSDPKTAKRVLADHGYTQVVTTGYSFGGCSQDDTFATGFRALSPAGKPVRGVVCSSLIFKGATIRLY